MPLCLLPDIVTPALTDLTLEDLQKRNIKLLMMDFDNTIVPYITNTPTPEVDAWLRRMAAAEIPVCVVSNSRKDRVKNFCAGYGIPCFTKAMKPFTRGIRECLAHYGIDPRDAALVGDQIYTDTLGGNAAGVTTILVRSLNNHNFWLKARHVLEKPFIYAARKRRLHHD